MINMKYFILWTDCASIYIVVLTPSKKWFPLGNIKFSPLYLSFRVYMTSHSLSNSINIYADYIISIWHFLCYLTEYDYNTHMVKELCRLFNHAFAFVITRFLNCEHLNCPQNEFICLLFLQKTFFSFLYFENFYKSFFIIKVPYK